MLILIDKGATIDRKREGEEIMRKIFKFLFVITLSLTAILFVGCGGNVDSISMDQTVVDTAVSDGKVDLSELKLIAKIGENTKEIKVTEKMITGGNFDDLLVPGTHELTFTYKGASTVVTFEIPDSPLKVIELDQTSVTEAYQKERFDHEDILVKLVYANGGIKYAPISTKYISSADLIGLYFKGEHKLTIKFAGMSIKTTINVSENKYRTISDLETVEDGKVVVVKGYLSYNLGFDLYLYDEKMVIKAEATASSTISEVSNQLAIGREIVICGTKTTIDGKLAIKDMAKIIVNDVVDTNGNEKVSKISDLESKLYKCVNFTDSKVVALPTTLNDSLDVTFEVSDGTDTIKVLIPKNEDNTFTQKVFITLSELAVGHVMNLDGLFVTKVDGVNTLIITKKSNVSYQKVIHEYQKPVEGPKNESFDDFTSDLFLYFIGDSPFNLNYQIYDIKAFDEKYGTHLADAPVVPTTEYDMTPQAEIDYYNELVEKKKALTSFDRETLSASQKLTYDVILDYLNRSLAYFEFDDNGENIYFYYGTQLGSYLGYQAQLPSIIAEYRFDDKKDIENYLEYLKTTLDDFKALYFFEKSKITAKKGNAMTDYVINLVIEQCDKFINTTEENYLITVFNDRIGTYDFLTSEEVEQYKELNKKYVNENFVEAYRWLKTSLEELKTINDDSLSGSLSDTEVGKKYYEVMFQAKCGSDMTIPELIKYIEDKLAEYETYSSYLPAFDGNLMEKAGIVAYDENKHVDYYASLNSIIPYFQEKIKEDFPELPVDFKFGTDIVIKEVAKALQENSSPAFYLTSPMDANISEVVYINPPDFSEVNSYMYSTIAHEAWPGHLFQNVYFKNSGAPDIRFAISYSGYAEGWANYVENYVAKYAIENYGMQQMLLLDPISSLSACRMDIGINYENWTVEDVIKSYGLTMKDVTSGRYTWTNGETVKLSDFEEMYYFYVEVPTNYLMYFFSSAQLMDIKADFKEKMGVYYSDKLFHTIYLETGDSSWPIIKAAYDNYAAMWGTNGSER